MSWATCTAGHQHWGRRGAAGLLLARRGTALLQLRASWVHRGGTWSVPGGALERRETAVDAALREASEELGMPADQVTVTGARTAECGGWTYETVLGHPHGELHLHDGAESDDHRWVPWLEVADLPLHPSFRLAWEHPDGVLRGFVKSSAEPGGRPRG
ncbi:hypothetical protein BH11ACT8_BH11ACT8_15830 [soil metagenome]